MHFLIFAEGAYLKISTALMLFLTLVAALVSVSPQSLWRHNFFGRQISYKAPHLLARYFIFIGWNGESVCVCEWVLGLNNIHSQKNTYVGTCVRGCVFYQPKLYLYFVLENRQVKNLNYFKGIHFEHTETLKTPIYACSTCSWGSLIFILSLCSVTSLPSLDFSSV